MDAVTSIELRELYDKLDFSAKLISMDITRLFKFVECSSDEAERLLYEVENFQEDMRELKNCYFKLYSNGDLMRAAYEHAIETGKDYFTGKEIIAEK